MSTPRFPSVRGYENMELITEIDGHRIYWHHEPRTSHPLGAFSPGHWEMWYSPEGEPIVDDTDVPPNVKEFVLAYLNLKS